MKKSPSFLVVALGMLLAVGGCIRNDDEPILPTRPIARLYVSIENYNDVTDPLAGAVRNVVIIDPADSTVFDSLRFDSGAMGGSGIHFNPLAGRVFQAGRLDTTIRLMTVSNLGVLATSGNIGNSVLERMRGLVFHQPSQMLYVASNTTTNRIFGFYQPMNRRGFTIPDKDLQLETSMRPWGLVMWGDNLLVSNAGVNGGVSLYENLSQADSVVTNFTAISTIRIEGATSIRGIAFIDSLDILVAADYGTQEGTDDGRVYIIEGIKSYLAQPSPTVVPTRTISGSATGIFKPVDVAIDPRENKKTIYVADRKNGNNGTVSKFNLSDNGNVAPQHAPITFQDRVPFGIFLDARGSAQ
ncbi:hypothetical protein [Parapedobacter tibetensis]|uniref:hypothetical protein n=1 Tax=Parapedobacter tibetensis TaxID=2972951 RepID=UPI00214D1BCD|nr:hypothetical protein [Parapedobacter tibetensis]